MLLHRSGDGEVGGIIVETEAYGPSDPANHAFRGQTSRNAVMFGSPGRAYVYRIYGIHWCLNAVTERGGVGEAVLIRALEPTLGLDIMRRNRGVDSLQRLCRGPGSLCSALGITGALNGADLRGPALCISSDRKEDLEIVETTRIGLTKAAERPWRFLAAANPYVSGPRRAVFGALR
jgi:DNA-3-methyladenine glycosylase